MRGHGFRRADQHIRAAANLALELDDARRHHASARRGPWRDTPGAAATAPPRARRAAARRRSGNPRRAAASEPHRDGAMPAASRLCIAISELLRRASAQGSNENGTMSRTPATSLPPPPQRANRRRTKASPARSRCAGVIGALTCSTSWPRVASALREVMRAHDEVAAHRRVTQECDLHVDVPPINSRRASAGMARTSSPRNFSCTSNRAAPAAAASGHDLRYPHQHAVDHSALHALDEYVRARLPGAVAVESRRCESSSSPLRCGPAPLTSMRAPWHRGKTQALAMNAVGFPAEPRIPATCSRARGDGS